MKKIFDILWHSCDSQETCLDNCFGHVWLMRLGDNCSLSWVSFPKSQSQFVMFSQSVKLQSSTCKNTISEKYTIPARHYSFNRMVQRLNHPKMAYLHSIGIQIHSPSRLQSHQTFRRYLKSIYSYRNYLWTQMPRKKLVFDSSSYIDVC